MACGTLAICWALLTLTTVALARPARAPKPRASRQQPSYQKVDVFDPRGLKPRDSEKIPQSADEISAQLRRSLDRSLAKRETAAALDGRPSVRKLFAALKEVSEFKLQLASLGSLATRGRLLVGHEDLVIPETERSISATSRAWTDWSQGAVKVALRAHPALGAGDYLLSLVHELTHVTDPQVLGEAFLSHLGQLPRELVSLNSKDITAKHVVRLPNGLHVESTFWNFISELNAYTVSAQVFGGSRAKWFAEGGRFPVTSPPVPVGVNYMAETTRERMRGHSIAEADIARFEMPDWIPAIPAHILQMYAATDGYEKGFMVDVRAPYLDRYAFLSIDAILNGALVDR